MRVTRLAFISTIIQFSYNMVNVEQGGYCMTMLYGIFPPAMAWAMLNKNGEGSNQKAASRARPTLVCVGLLAGVILLEQIFRDLSTLHS